MSFRTSLFALFFGIAVIAVILWRAPFMGGIWTLLKPAKQIGTAAQATLVSTVTSPAALLQENTELKAELAALQARVADRDELYRENILLKKQFGRSDAAASSTVLAGVLSAPPATPYDTLIIDAGSSQGIATGDLVAAAGGAYIGRVNDVSSAVARVELFSAPGEGAQGLLNGTVPVTVAGDGEGALSTQVPADTPVAVGDSVALPGIGEGIMAKVASVKTSAGSSFKDLYLQLPANISELQFVEVHRTLHQ